MLLVLGKSGKTWSSWDQNELKVLWGFQHFLGNGGGGIIGSNFTRGFGVHELDRVVIVEEYRCETVSAGWALIIDHMGANCSAISHLLE